MIKQDIHVLISIFCDVDDFGKEFEAEWEKILISKQPLEKVKKEEIAKVNYL